MSGSTGDRALSEVTKYASLNNISVDPTGGTEIPESFLGVIMDSTIIAWINHGADHKSLTKYLGYEPNAKFYLSVQSARQYINNGGRDAAVIRKLLKAFC